jgi:G-protein signaling modulator 2
LLYCRQTLQISRQLGDRALEAQACYSLGNTYTLLGDYQQAIEYHILHLRIARELSDSIGEARACWSLGNAHTALGQADQAVQYAVRHRDISIQVLNEIEVISFQFKLILTLGESTNLL